MNESNDTVEKVWLQILDIKSMHFRNRVILDLSDSELKSLGSSSTIKLCPSSNIVYIDSAKRDYYQNF